MGFSISWVALRLPKDRALEIMGFKDTGMADEANEAPFSAASLPTGWTIIWSNDFEYAVSPSTIGRSSDTEIVGCQVEEHVMFSSCFAAQNGIVTWNVSHDAQEGTYDVSSTGPVPHQLRQIEISKVDSQNASGGVDSDVDHLIDVPIDLAASFTGYRYDEFNYDWGSPEFSIIEQDHS
jgi:hypothetical protein